MSTASATPQKGLSLRLLSRISPSHAGAAPFIAGILLLAVILLTIFSPWIAPHDPLKMDPLLRLKPPSEAHILGTDAFGRDLFSRMILGGRVSLLVGLSAAVVALFAGIYCAALLLFLPHFFR